MELATFIWVASIINGLKYLVLGTGAAILFVNISRCSVFLGAFDRPPYERTKSFKIYSLVGIAILYAGTLLPSERTMYMMAGGYLGQAATQSKTASLVVDIIDSKLEEYATELENTANLKKLPINH